MDLDDFVLGIVFEKAVEDFSHFDLLVQYDDAFGNFFFQLVTDEEAVLEDMPEALKHLSSFPYFSFSTIDSNRTTVSFDVESYVESDSFQLRLEKEIDHTRREIEEQEWRLGELLYLRK